MKGTIFNIQRFSVNDGPGIRTTVFLKGCPLSCAWCHNPESKRSAFEIFFGRDKCTLCGRCVAVCKLGAHEILNGIHNYDRKKCIACAECTDVCFFGALEAVGRTASVDEVLSEVMKDKAFYESSGGGITVSGGEPMMQFDFTLELLRSAKENGLNTCMETSGYADAEKYAAIAPFVDIFLYDYKLSDTQLHKKYTGVGNERILENLKMLDALGAKTVLRCPIIPTVNDTDEHFMGIAKTANELKNIIEINIEPYHPLGSSKSALLERDYPLSEIGFTKDDTVNEWIEKIKRHTNVDVKKA